METKHRQSNSETSGQAMDVAGRGPVIRDGRTLRHWTTDHLDSMGKATATASGAGDWGLAEGRQRNLVASRLKSLARRTGAL